MTIFFTVMTVVGYLIDNPASSQNLSEQVYTLEEVYNEVMGFARRYPLLATIGEIGSSYENRPIYCMIIHDRSISHESTLIANFGIHGREWASPAAGIYLMKQLIIKMEYRELIQKIKWYIIPMVNPDGYRYSTMKDAGESAPSIRFWRKNRRPLRTPNCYGVDLNRNFPVGFDDHLSLKEAECKPIFSGFKPLSEPETQAIDGLLSRLGYVDAIVSVHSCSQSITYPYSYKATKPRFEHMKKILFAANAMRRKMQEVAGTNYSILSGYEQFTGGGTMDDYAFVNFNIPLVFTLGLGHKNEDKDKCFHPDPKELSQLEQESLAAFIALGQHLTKHLQDLHRLFDPYARKSNGLKRSPSLVYCALLINIVLTK